MEASITHQLYVMLCSVLIGTLFGLIYDTCQLLKMILSPVEIHGLERIRLLFKYSNKSISKRKEIVINFVWDILFFVIITLISIVFVHGANNGSFRLFIMIGGIVGFVAYKATIGKIVNLLFSLLVIVFKSLFDRLLNIIKKPIKSFVKLLKGKIAKLMERLKTQKEHKKKMTSKKEGRRIILSIGK